MLFRSRELLISEYAESKNITEEEAEKIITTDSVKKNIGLVDNLEIRASDEEIEDNDNNLSPKHAIVSDGNLSKDMRNYSTSFIKNNYSHIIAKLFNKCYPSGPNINNSPNPTVIYLNEPKSSHFDSLGLRLIDILVAASNNDKTNFLEKYVKNISLANVTTETAQNEVNLYESMDHFESRVSENLLISSDFVTIKQSLNTVFTVYKNGKYKNTSSATGGLDKDDASKYSNQDKKYFKNLVKFLKLFLSKADLGVNDNFSETTNHDMGQIIWILTMAGYMFNLLLKKLTPQELSNCQEFATILLSMTCIHNIFKTKRDRSKFITYQRNLRSSYTNHFNANEDVFFDYKPSIYISENDSYMTSAELFVFFFVGTSVNYAIKNKEANNSLLAFLVLLMSLHWNDYLHKMFYSYDTFYDAHDKIIQNPDFERSIQKYMPYVANQEKPFHFLNNSAEYNKDLYTLKEELDKGSTPLTENSSIYFGLIRNYIADTISLHKNRTSDFLYCQGVFPVIHNYEMHVGGGNVLDFMVKDIMHFLNSEDATNSTLSQFFQSRPIDILLPYSSKEEKPQETYTNLGELTNIANNDEIMKKLTPIGLKTMAKKS